VLTCVVPLLTALSARAQSEPVSFDWFEYTGRDTVFEQPLSPAGFRNPILAGFHPDPSITRAGDRFYLVNSSFTYFPGIPVFESTDLVHWRQIGNVIDRPSELKFDGLSVSRGLFAPSIQFHRGTFYVLNTAVDSGGNFLALASNPAGPWSDPFWLPQLDGIDPSLYFDDDGRTYLLNNGPPQGPPQYDGHRAIWIQEFDLATHKLFGPRKVLVNGGVDFSNKPIWIEGPHLYKREGWYYLMCAEGGTSSQHSEVVLRSHSPWGPFKAFAGNPILTQRDLPIDRPDPIADAGHADLIEAPDGRWWAVFLAVRTYDRVHYNTGRETFLLPVSWTGGWPVILGHGRSIPYIGLAPTLSQPQRTGAPMTGNFTWRDDFDSPSLQAEWLQVRVPMQPWADLHSRAGWLTIHPLPASLDTLGNPSFLARRQQHLNFDASTAFDVPVSGHVAAGIAIFQNENYWYFLGVRRVADQLQLFLEKDSGRGAVTVASAIAPEATHTKLKISARARAYSFFYDTDGQGWQSLRQDDDGSILSTDIAGGFVGAVVGPFARAE
jgi:xylan 1,4-beta-xylosidase